MASPLLTNDKFCQGFFCGAYLSLGLYSFIAKFLQPMLVAAAEGNVWLAYVTWDLWWLLYLVLGWKMQYPSKGIWQFAIIITFLDFFLSAYRLFTLPRAAIWTYWVASLFFNNLASFALAFLLFFYLFFGLDQEGIRGVKIRITM